MYVCKYICIYIYMNTLLYTGVSLCVGGEREKDVL